MLLVTLGGRHLLDGLVVVTPSKHARRLCVAPEKACERFVLTSRGSRRATLVERDVKSNKWSGGSSASARDSAPRGSV